MNTIAHMYMHFGRQTGLSINSGVDFFKHKPTSVKILELNFGTTEKFSPSDVGRSIVT